MPTALENCFVALEVVYKIFLNLEQARKTQILDLPRIRIASREDKVTRSQRCPDSCCFSLIGTPSDIRKFNAQKQ